MKLSKWLTFNDGSVQKTAAIDPLPSYGKGLGLLNSYDRLRGCYNLKSSNTRRIDQGLGRCQSGGMAEHVWIGTSESAGQNSAVGVYLFDRLNAAPMSFRNALANMGVPANGTGLIRTVDSTLFADSRNANAGTWVNNGGYGSSTVAGSTYTISPDRSGTAIDVLYYDYASSTGQFTVKVDGTVVSTINVNGTNPVTGTGWKIARIMGLNIIANFSSIVITVVAPGTGGLAFAGVEPWTPNAGLRVHNISQSGSTAAGTGMAAWVDTTTNTGLSYIYQPSTGLGGTSRTITDAVSTSGANTLTSATAAFTTADLGKPIDCVPGASGLMFPFNSYISGITSGTVVTLSTVVNGQIVNANANASETAQTVNIGRPPDCIHIELGGNDLNAGTAVATITAAITTIRNRYSTSDCILHLPVEFSTAFVSAANELAFEQAMFALADTLDCMIFDWRDQVGTFAQGQALGWYGDNAVHVAPAAGMMIGASLASVLGPGSGRNQTQVTPLYDNDVVPKWYIDRRKTKTSTAATAANTTEAVILKLPIPAGGLAVGDVLRYSMWLTPSATSTTTVRVRIGSTGTVSDASVITMSVTAATSTAARYCEGQTGIAVIGASATHIGGGTETVGAVTAAGSATAATSTFNSTVNNYATVTVQNGSSVTTTCRAGTLEWV